MEEKLIFKHRFIEHPKDVEYFKQFPAPLMELIHSGHNVNINATLPFWGPFFYFLVRSLKCEKVLEIGTAEGYSSWYLANAVNDNAVRNGYTDAIFYGIDIVKTEDVKKELDKVGLPNIILNLDTANLTPQTFDGIQFDLIFQDGNHEKKYVLHEIDVLYPQLKGNGLGYLLMHDIMGPSSEAFQEIKDMIKKGIYNFEYTILDDGIYGLAVLRKMENYIERKYPY